MFAEADAHSPEIDAAIEALEAHREEYERLAADPHELLRRTEELFIEERFDSMRYHAADVQRAFDAVGHPLPGKLDKRYLETLEEAIHFLADDAEQAALANRLLCMLPEFVATGRYVDGWIIQNSARMMLDPSAGTVAPFLKYMFMRSVDDAG